MLEALAFYALVLYIASLSNSNPAPEGYTSYDPCFSCGEDWQFYPNDHIHGSNDVYYINKPQWQETK